MSKANDAFEGAVMSVARRSGWTVAVITLILYPGAGLLAPLALRWSTLALVEANVLGVTMAAVVSFGWFVVQLEARDRRHLVEWTSNLRLLSPEEFEWLVGEVFRREGWTVRETGRQAAPDGNIDLDLRRGSKRVVVQCKRWRAQLVGVDEIRQFAGTLMREGLSGDNGIFVTLSAYTPQALAEAKRACIEVVDGRDLYQRVEQARRKELCPTCRSAMLLDRSPRGWWFRCAAPGCGGKRDLGADPARAIELLTAPR